ncbi:MAG: hypothetical protein ACI8QZ_001461 [Chlamydiales bacterium]
MALKNLRQPPLGFRCDARALDGIRWIMTNPISSPSTHAVLLACGLASLAFVGIPSLGPPQRTGSGAAFRAPIDRALFHDGVLNQARTTAGYLRESSAALVTISVATVQSEHETYLSWATRHARAVETATRGLGTDAVQPLGVGGFATMVDPTGIVSWTDDSGRATELRVSNPQGGATHHLDALECFTSRLAPAGSRARPSE